ncbi:MAG: vitamin B12-dependent ribonucleotide reductase [Thermoplasmata archaeon]|nr:MAG: vitamin B12-dependent ribonucleotide reductase [Thermoplasmata archaeon]
MDSGVNSYQQTGEGDQFIEGIKVDSSSKPSDKPKQEKKERKLELTANALKVLQKRYLRKDDNGKVLETPEEMFRRIAANIASADLKYHSSEEVRQIEKKFYNVMVNLEFLPNSPTLMNAGRELQQLSACFVLPIKDDMNSIFETIKNTALIHKSGGGTGFSFSSIRPKNDVVKSTGGVASGPISFMKVFNASTEEIKQGGTRRGANMAILRVDHPDIMEFVECKKEEHTLNNFNISVAITDKFMDALKSHEPFPLVNPRTNQVAEMVEPQVLFEKIVEMAWRNGEPGVIFLDRINADNTTPDDGDIESTNPCGEQPLLPYESCNLGSINLEKMVRAGDVDWDKLDRTINIAVHFLDNVIDMNNFPLEEIRKMTEKNRKIGLGVMGFADMLVQLGIPYNSERAVKVAERVMKFILERSHEASAELAKIRGAFPGYNNSIFRNRKGLPFRNATTTTIAPTGTISMIADSSSGIEPMFSISFTKTVMDNNVLSYVNKYFKKHAKERGFYSEELMKQIAKKGSIQDMDEIPYDIRKIFTISHDISPEWHVKMQAAFQKYTDNAVSKTINFPHEATQTDVRNAYMLAYELGCKGITIYRDRSREEQVLEFEKKKLKAEGELIFKKPRPRPSVTKGMTVRAPTGCGNLYVTINEDKKGLCEVFAQMGKGGGCAASQAEAVGRLISLALRSGIQVESILEELEGIRCPSPLYGKGPVVKSCPDAIAKAIENHLKENQKTKDVEDIVDDTLTLDQYSEESKKDLNNIEGVCPDCGNALISEGGCMVCIDRACGYTKCG